MYVSRYGSKIPHSLPYCVSYYSGQADFRRNDSGLVVVRSNMYNGVTLTYKNFRQSVHCASADGNPMLAVRFVEGRDQIAATYDTGLVGIWDLNLKWLCTVTHPSKVLIIAVSCSVQLDNRHLWHFS